ncbi:hypothetical protein [Streptomyces jeddahensis]|uniref:Uncharacterized protein n=1 Tax=Streptomyces jeddahensis TaxID=1716141 RepID=A0A177HJ08_9ACTN|nr:hypothetical protein [Streptomyces jeddahensis]OAH10726.1 hypothetical protein STSP_59650 [Streptomyces jeddahensis]
MGAIVLVVGIIGIGAVIAAVVVFAAMRGRRNSVTGPVNPGAGTYPQHMGYPPQQPIHPPAQQPYPPTPYQGYPTPSGQPPQYPNPYAQQPPNPGQQAGQ